MSDTWPPRENPWLDSDNTTPSTPAGRDVRRERRRKVVSDALNDLRNEISELRDQTRRDQDDFREDIQKKMHKIERWAAVQEERTLTDRAKAAGRDRFITWGIGILLTLLGILLPLMIAKQ